MAVWQYAHNAQSSQLTLDGVRHSAQLDEGLWSWVFLASDSHHPGASRRRREGVRNRNCVNILYNIQLLYEVLSCPVLIMDIACNNIDALRFAMAPQ